MKTIIVANAVTFNNDGDCPLLGFADDGDDPVNYIILQITNAPDEEEIANGWAGVHIDTGVLGIEGYGMVENIRAEGRDVILKLASDSALNADIEQIIIIEITNDVTFDQPLADAIEVFAKRVTS